MTERSKIGIIGGSGLYNFEGSEVIEEISLDTPWGEPSDVYSKLKIGESEIIFLPRHGKDHKLLPSEINYRANIYGMKKLGVDRIISVSAVGSYKEEIAPGDIVIVDQFFDRTKRGIESTYFGKGVAGHIAFAEPICPVLANILFDALSGGDSTVHKGGTYVNMEGPAFSSKAESLFFKNIGMHVIGMTNIYEARLSREAEICFVTMALVTDYDAWHEELEPVSVPEVIANLNASVGNARKCIVAALPNIPDERDCICSSSLRSAIITDKTAINDESRERLSLFIEKYLD